MNSRRLLLMAATAMILPTIVAAAAGELTGRITIDVSKKLGPVNYDVLGQNLEAADSQFIFSEVSSPTAGQTGDGIWDPKSRKPVEGVIALAKDVGSQTLRYPGGCLVHNFDWHVAVGPVEERPNYTFGINEYLEVCNALGSEPMMTVSAYRTTPQDAADLVEYLNAPAEEKFPWAMKRAQWGHPEPFGVVYFEMGNESDHGNHTVKPFRKLTPDEYADWYNQCAAKMRAIDPRIKIGALTGTGTGPQDPWNRIVLSKTKDQLDFVIVHTYVVGLWTMGRENASKYDTNALMQACMAAPAQTEQMLAEYRQVIRSSTGRDVPMSITEYNAMFVEDLAIAKPLRFSLGGALFSADYVRVLLKPETNVISAQYWQLLNAYWGLIRSFPNQAAPEQYLPMPAYYCYRLWNQHFGQELVNVDVESPTVEFDGILHVRPARSGETPPTPQFEVSGASGQGFEAQATGPREAKMLLTNFTAESYPPLVEDIPAMGGRTYKLSYEARLESPLNTSDIALGLGIYDGRGWEATQSANAVQGAETAIDWQPFECSLTTLPDCTSLDLMWRLIGKDTPVNATLLVRKVTITPVADLPPYPALTASSSVSEDGKKLYLMVFNKHHQDAISASISVQGAGLQVGKMWRVTGSSLDATNVKAVVGAIAASKTLAGMPESEAWTAAEKEVAAAYGPLDKVTAGETVSGDDVSLEATGLTHIFPPYSMTAFEFELSDGTS